MTSSQVVDHMGATGQWTGSWLAANAVLAAIPDGPLQATHGSVCPMCAHRFLPGETAHPNPVLGSQKFNDGAALCGGEADPICAACASTQGKMFIMNVAKSVVTPDGIWKFASNEDISWWLLNPPETPFAMVYSLAKQQHVFWRAPIGRNRNVFPIRVGQNVGMIRRSWLTDAAECIEGLMAAALTYEKEQQAALSKNGAKVKKTKSLVTVKSHPFIRLDRDLLSSWHGSVKPVVAKYLSSGQAPREAALLMGLNMLELWGLAAIVNNKAAARASAPPPLFSAPNGSPWSPGVPAASTT